MCSLLTNGSFVITANIILPFVRKKMSKNGFNMTGLFRVKKAWTVELGDLSSCLTSWFCASVSPTVEQVGWDSSSGACHQKPVSVGSGGQSPCGAWNFAGAQAQGAIQPQSLVGTRAYSRISCCLLSEPLRRLPLQQL